MVDVIKNYFTQKSFSCMSPTKSETVGAKKPIEYIQFDISVSEHYSTIALYFPISNLDNRERCTVSDY